MWSGFFAPRQPFFFQQILTTGNNSMNSDSEYPIPNRPEHFALNVAAPLAMVQWYTRNLQMKVKRQGGPPTHTTFIADVTGHIMLELFCNTNFPMLNLRQLHPMTLHLAIMTDDIAGTKRALLEVGAVVAEDIARIPTGDKVLMMRDPWGFALQFVQRSLPMLVQTHFRAEHVAFNVSDSRAQAQWHQTHFGMRVKREGGAPTFGMFIADTNEHMMLELYQNSQHPMLDLPKVSYMAVHIASMVPDVALTRKKLLAVGATIAEDMTTTPGGDTVLMLRDPWGLPIQFVKRVESMLEPRGE
jgi:uncharacterized glyoxalase superfamily protein PhnB